MSKRDKAKAARAGLQAHAQKTGDKTYQDVAALVGITTQEIADFMARKNEDAALATRLATAIGVKVPEIEVQDFRKSGYMPEALLNFIALVGWAPGENREIVSREQMVELFGFDGVQKTSGKFDRKKLAWMNGEYIRQSSIERLEEVLAQFNAVTDYPLKNADATTRRALLAMYQERMVSLAEMAENSDFFFIDTQVYDTKAVEKHIRNNQGQEFLTQTLAVLEPVTDWTLAGLHEPMERVLSLGEKKGAAAQAVRVALSGRTVSPPLLETIALLGRERTLNRLRAGINL